MAGVNKVILLGNLGSDPEVRSLPSGSKVATFNIATSEAYNNKEGQRVEQTEWHRIELWNKLAEIAEQYLKKGNTVFIEGRIRSEEYVDKDGITRKVTKIQGSSMTLVGGRNTVESSVENSAAPAPQPSRPAPVPMPAPVPDFQEGDADDLPF
jgi:single-strand DNA-binding protein